MNAVTIIVGEEKEKYIYQESMNEMMIILFVFCASSPPCSHV